MLDELISPKPKIKALAFPICSGAHFFLTILVLDEADCSENNRVLVYTVDSLKKSEVSVYMTDYERLYYPSDAGKQAFPVLASKINYPPGYGPISNLLLH